MALMWMEGFDFYGSQANLARKYPIGAAGTFGIGPGRVKGNSLMLPRNAASSMVVSPLPARQSMVIGLGVQFTGTVSSIPGFLKFRQDGVTHFSLNLNANSTISVAAQSVLGTIPLAIPASQWVHLQVRFTVSNTAGSIEIVANGGSPFTVAPCNNWNSLAAMTVNQIAFSNLTGTTADVLIDDFFALDTAVAPNGFLGALVVESLHPTGAGNSSGWNATGAGTNYGAVGEDYADGDTTFVAAAPSALDLYTFPDLAGQSALYGVDVNLLASREDGGVPRVAPMVRSGATNYTGTSQAAPTAYNYQHQLYPTDPATGIAWTRVGVNAAEFGIMRTT